MYVYMYVFMFYLQSDKSAALAPMTSDIIKEGVVKERLLQIASVTTQVAISRRVSRLRLQLRGRRESRRSRGGGGEMTDPHRWRGDGA